VVVAVVNPFIKAEHVASRGRGIDVGSTGEAPGNGTRKRWGRNYEAVEKLAGHITPVPGRWADDGGDLVAKTRADASVVAARAGFCNCTVDGGGREGRRASKEDAKNADGSGGLSVVSALFASAFHLLIASRDALVRDAPRPGH